MSFFTKAQKFPAMCPRSHNEAEPSAFNYCHPMATIREDKEKSAIGGGNEEGERKRAGYYGKCPQVNSVWEKIIP